jgi:hypothetical protein
MTGGVCVDIDACTTQGSPSCLGTNVVCQDLPAPAGPTGRRCVCDLGYAAGVDQRCRAVDACVTSPCPGTSNCTDLPPPASANADGRTCACGMGLEIGVDGSGLTTCIDIDSCRNVNVSCPATQTCIDLAAPTIGYRCGCPYGFEALPVTGLCTPIIPCAVLPACPANTICTNLPYFNVTAVDSRVCSCATGYAADSSGACVDINACNVLPCDTNAICRDHVGEAPDRNGRSCVCNTGYTGNGEICVATYSTAAPTPDPGTTVPTIPTTQAPSVAIVTVSPSTVAIVTVSPSTASVVTGAGTGTDSSSSDSGGISLAMLVIIILLALLVFAMIVIGFKVSNNKEAAAPPPVMHGVASFENPAYESGAGQSNQGSRIPSIADASGGYLDVHANAESGFDTYADFDADNG